ncbi:beta-ketoacyl-ACP synthase [Falsiroseomonas selenitidurans]|uniref:Beta-ketoacyl-ACP synthase n=1 Tax=Falsiroseomonas selenitidurans TaxID=2716335 RepID=A0ABX1E9S4_9PROT|nr:beta-ketoacyl-ACP synthase [Falsiroseomonas selenitidurans]NKC33989.1 beta-ketoacyl-ACP synthase [Falsiroseomonas selenitidurans]
MSEAPVPASPAQEIWITGIGLVSAAGEGRAAHRAALLATTPAPVDTTSHAPFPLHPAPPLELDRQIPKKGDQRQMEPWQRLGTYAAGLALDDAGARGLVGEMDLLIAAGGGERDLALDESVLAALAGLPAAEAATRLNELLAGGLRPTLFLAQLSNLLAGNISIVHGVTGASRTLMGEEQAGADAVRIAAARLAEGRGRIALVGGAFVAARWDLLLLYHAGGLLRQGGFAPVFSRAEAPGAIPGLLGAFLVLETGESARARGARGLARIAGVACEQARRDARGGSAEAAARAFARLALPKGSQQEPLAVLSGATGIAAPAAAEAAFLAGLGRPVALRAAGSRLGWGAEATFPASLALGALMLAEGLVPPPLEAAEAPLAAAPRDLLVTGFGAWRGEALAHLQAIGETQA